MAFLRQPEALAPMDLPARNRTFWQMAGPGAVLVGLSIGAGEIVIWPRIAAEFGGSMIWAAVVGVFLQLWVNLEIGRWTVSTGETVYTGFARIWRGFAPLMMILIVLGYLAPGWAMASGLALKAILVGPDFGSATSQSLFAGLLGSQTFWTVLTFAGVAAALFGPRLMYQSMERVIEILLVLITVGLGVVAIAVGTSNLFYSFYLRDKNIGMGARLPAMANPLRGRHATVPATGYRFPDDEVNRRRFRSWLGYIRRDQMIFFFGLNSLTILLFIFGALAVLHPRGIVPDPNALIFDQAAILGQVWGGAGRFLFLVVGMATLFSTQLVLVDGVARSLADIVYTSVRGARRRELSWWYLVFAGSWIVVGCVVSAIMESFEVTNLGFILNAAYMGGFAMAIYVPLMLYLNLRYLPAAARPGHVSIAMMGLASLVYAGFAVSCVVWEIQGVLARLSP